MFVFSVLIVTASAYINYPPYGFPPPPPPPYAHYNDYFYDHESSPKHCADLTLYLPRKPTVLREAFYAPTIRYIRSGKRTVQALVACDADGDTINALFAAKNISNNLDESYLISFGTSAGAVLTCQKNHSYTGSALVDAAPGYSKNISVTSLACLRFDKTIDGVEAAAEVTAVEQLLSSVYNDATSSARKKRETAEETTVASTPETTTTTTEATQTTDETTTSASETTTSTDASEPTTTTSNKTETSILGGMGNVLKGF